jgi:hypothetical protein
MLMEKPLKKISKWRRMGVQGVLSSSSTINMLFLELNTLKPCENIREKWEEGDFESKITVLNSANDDSCGIEVQLKGSKMSDVIKETTIVRWIILD